jgi:DNA-binding FadR family transcriptional regulator
LHVGRTTVREALKLLTVSGLLVARRGSGTFVRDEFASFVAHQLEWPALLHAQDVDAIFEVREALEVQIARLAARRASPKDLEAMTVYRKLLELPGRDFQRETEIDLEFHRALAAASHNRLLIRLMRALENPLREYVTLSNQLTGDVKTTVREHEALYDAVRSGNPEAAGRAMAEHLVISRNWIGLAAENGERAQLPSEEFLHGRDERARAGPGRNQPRTA